MANHNIAFLSEAELGQIPFARRGKNVLIDASARIIGVERVSIGDNVRIDAGVIIVASGPVVIGKFVHVGANSYLEGRGGLEIEDFANLSSYVSLHSVSDDFSGASLTNPTTPEDCKTLVMGPIRIARHAALGVKATVLPNVTLYEGAVLGAHSLASRDCEAWTINAGTPARRIKERSRALLAFEERVLREHV